MTEFNTQCEREVLELHVFFEQWLRGDLDEQGFERFSNAIAEDFMYVLPDAKRLSRNEIAGSLRGARGAFGANTPVFRIEVRAMNTRTVGSDLLIASYEEWQDLPDGQSARLGSALMRRRERAPLGVEWVHLHETWLPGRSEADLQTPG